MTYYFKPNACVQYKKFVTVKTLFSADECEKIKALHTSPHQAGIRLKGDLDESVRKSRITWIYPNLDTKWIFERIEKAVAGINQAHWNFQLSQIAALQLTEYTEKGHYNWHEDIGEGAHATRKLSVVIQLNDSSHYTGGDFQIFPNDKGDREQGAATMFPSYVTHKVNPVESGTRMSLVVWVEGPSFI